MTTATRRALIAAMHICAQETELARARKEILASKEVSDHEDAVAS